MKPNVLVVDDEADIRELVEITLSRMGLRSHAAANLSEARLALSEQEFDLCITDMRLPDGDGTDLVRHIQTAHPTLPVAVITAFGSTEAAVECLKAGAFDFVSKPVDLQVLRKLVDAAIKLGDQSLDTKEVSDISLTGTTPAMVALGLMVERLARSQAPVHIAGESGSGKERVARLIHAKGPRAEQPFIPVNCGAIPSELMESEFFGHLKGSFTGATRDKSGLFQAAEGGTLFLDEVAELPLHMQVKLLRALQERSVRPVGSEQELPVNVRIISATHQDLALLTADGHFRQDLYYRLNVIEVRVPPLRERRADIAVLAQQILGRIQKDHGRKDALTLAPDALALLGQHPFPGNVRELENVLERAVTLTDAGVVKAEALQLRASPTPTPAPAATPAPTAPTAGKPLGRHVEDVETRAIVDALEQTGGNKTRAAALLGMTFRQLRYRIKKLRIG